MAESATQQPGFVNREVGFPWFRDDLGKALEPAVGIEPTT
jgi:hypothetical protein